MNKVRTGATTAEDYNGLEYYLSIKMGAAAERPQWSLCPMARTSRWQEGHQT